MVKREICNIRYVLASFISNFVFMFTAAITTSAVKKHLISLLSNNLLCVKICSIIKYYDKRTIKTSSRTYDVHARNTCTVFCMSTWEELPGLPTERGEKIAYKNYNNQIC